MEEENVKTTKLFAYVFIADNNLPSLLAKKLAIVACLLEFYIANQVMG
jgi:hypothetical protein